MEKREILLNGLKDFAPDVPETGTRWDVRSSSKGPNRCQDHTMPRAYWKGSPRHHGPCSACQLLARRMVAVIPWRHST
jgi:hypothetical protein